jgi:hypothetical protein
MQRRLILIAENHGKGYKPLKYSNRPFQVERVASRQRLKVLGHAGSSKKVPWPWLERDKHPCCSSKSRRSARGREGFTACFGLLTRTSRVPLKHLPRSLVCSDSDKARATKCPMEGAKELRTRVHGFYFDAVVVEMEMNVGKLCGTNQQG